MNKLNPLVNLYRSTLPYSGRLSVRRVEALA